MRVSKEAVGARMEKFQNGKGRRLEITAADKARGGYQIISIVGIHVHDAHETVCVHCPLHGSGKGECCGVDHFGKIAISASCETPKLLARALCNLLDYVPKK